MGAYASNAAEELKITHFPFLFFEEAGQMVHRDEPSPAR
jgi:hypothetical protein